MSNGGCAGGILACNVPRRERLNASGPQYEAVGSFAQLELIAGTHAQRFQYPCRKRDLAL